MTLSKTEGFVVFDVGGVVTRADEQICFNALRRLGVASQNITEMYHCEDYYRYLRGQINPQEYHTLIVRKYFDLQVTFEQLRDAFKSTTYAINPGVVDVLGKLDRSRLVFLTDTTVWQDERVAELIDLRLFSDKIFRSNEMSMVKTDDGCFPYVASRLGVKPEKLMLIDDSIEKINMAGNDRWDTFHFVDAEALQTFLNQSGWLQ